MYERKLLPPLAALRTFEAVGRLRGIRKAAEALGVDHATVSRQVRALEAWLGIDLVDRDGPPGRLTKAGAAYHARVSAAFAELADATAGAMGRETKRLRVWCVPGFAAQWLTPRLEQFRAAHPDLDLEFRPSDAAPDFAAHEADVDIRYIRDGQPAPPVRVRRMELARPDVFPVMSPSFARLLPRSPSPRDLLAAPLLHEESDAEWLAWLARAGVAPPQRLDGPRLWHAHVCLDMARRGQGIALANALLAADDLETGQLVRVPFEAGILSAQLGAYALATRADRWSSPPVVAFRRWLGSLL